jgi:hypothetical protein
MNLKSLTEMPIRFRKVNGGFYCSQNQLTKLEGAPSTVGRSFNCSDNNIISLKGAPLEVGGSFYCSNNYLTSLQYAPSAVGVDFFCSYNKLLSITCLSVIKGDIFNSYINPLKITGGVRETVKQMTHEQQMAELNFFDENDLNASKMLQEILYDLNINYGTHRKEMRKITKDLNLGYLGI